jgi:hypothetical protein
LLILWLLALVALLLALSVLGLSSRAATGSRAFPWLLLPLLFLPAVFHQLDQDFIALLALYLTFPSTLGPLSLVFFVLLPPGVGWANVDFWLLALALAVLWMALIGWLWTRVRWLGYAVWLAGLIFAGLFLYNVVLPIN